MFGKRPAPQNSLTDRVRELGERPRPATSGGLGGKIRLRADRRVTFKDGSVILPSGERYAVVIKDVSDTGARIEFFVRTTLPDEFVLSEPTLKLRRRVRVTWQRDGVAGLQFID